MKYAKIILVLTLISVFSAGILSVADLLSRQRIAANQKEAFDRATTTLIPEAARVEQDGDIYKVFGKDQSLIAYIFVAEGQGYQGPIKILCGASVSFDKLLGIEILESTETPGLGARISGAWFRDQFNGLDITRAISYTKTKPVGKSQIQAITGATISSRSVVGILNRRIEEIRQSMKGSL